MNRIPKSSPRTFKMESTGPKVPSRYLSGPTSSCHDHCKCETKHSTESKPMNPSPKRLPRPPTTETKPTNRSRSITPKTTRSNLKNNNVVKDQTLKKDVSIEPKKQAKTSNGPSSRTPRRRLSDNFVPNKDLSLPSSKLPKRRLSEIIIHPKTDIASVSKGSTVRGRVNNIESIKDSKLPIVNKKFSSVKPSVSTTKVNAKVSPLRNYRSVPKPEVKAPRKIKLVKPIEEPVHEPKNDVKIIKSQSQDQNSADCSPSSSEVKAMEDDQNVELESAPPQMEDDTTAKDDQHSSLDVKAMKDDNHNDVVESSSPSKKDDQNEVVESSSPSKEEEILEKDDQNEVVESSSLSKEDDIPEKDDQNEVVESSSPSKEEEILEKDDKNEVVESSSPSKEDDIPKKDDQNEVVESSLPSKEDDILEKDDQNKVVESSLQSKEDDILEKDDQNEVVESSLQSKEDDIPKKDDQNGVLESSAPSMEDDNLAKKGQHLSSDVKAMEDDDQRGMVEESSLPSIEDDTLAKDGQQNDNGLDLDVDETNKMAQVKKLVVETELRFKRGTILSPEYVNNDLRELKFKKGTELEKKDESVSISADLKHQETEEKKAAVLNNNIIEEAASKLIQARKSKVRALVGAFETIVSSETESSSYTSKSAKML